MMDTYTNAQWTDTSLAAVMVDWTTTDTPDGSPVTQRIQVNAIPGVLRYDAILAHGLTIAAAPALTVDQVVDVVQFQISFNHENRIRTLEGKAALTAAQFKTALKALLGL